MNFALNRSRHNEMQIFYGTVCHCLPISVLLLLSATNGIVVTIYQDFSQDRSTQILKKIINFNLLQASKKNGFMLLCIDDLCNGFIVMLKQMDLWDYQSDLQYYLKN